jgi:hypothetical protein
VVREREQRSSPAPAARMDPPPPLPPTDRYRAHSDAPRASLGRGGEAVYDPLRRRVDALSAVEAVVFAGCRRLGTLDEQAACVVEGGAAGTRAAIRGILNDLVERGVLLSEAELQGLFASAAGADEVAPKIATIGIPTRDRPESLRRALETHAEDIAARGRDIDMLVLDDTSSEEATARARAIAQDVESRFGTRVRYADGREKAWFAGEIARLSGAPESVVRAALAPEVGAVFAGGAARNALLLDAVGRCSLQVDDDTLCNPRPAPGGGGKLRAVSFEDPTEFWFDEGASSSHGSSGGGTRASERGELEGVERPEGARDPDVGYAELHERLLGRRAAALALQAMSRGNAELGGASTHLLQRIAAGGRVACTQLGVRGDSAMGAMGYLLTIAQPSRGRLLASEATYRRAVQSRRVVRAVPAATLTEQELCMTFAIGLDGRTPLPPFPPLDRNEDGLFGALLGACDPDAVFGHLPWTVAHEPEDARRAGFEVVFEQAARVGINDLLGGLVSLSRNELDLRDPRSAIASLGRSLIAWSAVPEADLFERLAWMLARRLAQRLARIDAVLREGRRAPGFWAHDLDRLADVIRERAEEPERAVPFELVQRYGLAEARRRSIQRVRELGEILVCWPAMIDAAQALHERGVRLGEARS